MNATGNKDSVKIKKIVDRYNMMANLFWSVLNLAPISVFCYRLVVQKWFYVSLAISLLTAFLPQSFFDTIQLSKRVSFYRKNRRPIH